MIVVLEEALDRLERKEARVNLKYASMLKRDSKGFTVIELLIVIAIIAILMGLLMPMIAAVQRSARNKHTKALIVGLSAALQMYKTQFDEFPPSTVADPFLNCTPAVPVDNWSLYKYLCGADGRGPVQFVNGTQRRFEPFYTPPPEFIVKSGNEVHIIDAWGKDIVYLNCKWYTDAKTVLDPNYTSSTDKACHNPTSFDLYSTGPDQKKDPNHNHIDDNNNGMVDEALELVDDITNYPGS